jgi:hypothetical protein
MPFGTITSTSNTFGSISGDVGANVPGTLSGSVGVPGPQGPPGPGSTWGTILGTISAQTDLWTELGTKYPASNPSGFITASALSPYLLSSTASTTYQTLAGMSAYLTTSAAASSYYPLASNPSGFITSTALTPYLTSATAASTYQPISGMTAYLTTASAASTYAPIAAGLPTGGTVGQVLTKNSGTSWDDSWQTLIPGDRYLTSSTTSLTINNADKTLTVGTGLSYSSQQDIVITHDAANHMHARVLTYNSGTGVMTVDVLSHSGAGTYATWTVNVGGAPALASVVWGDITGTLGAQGDLAAALGNKLETSDAASTYQTIAGMSSYLTTADAATTYYLNTNPDAFITASALSGYATESWVGSQGYLTSGSLSGYLTTVDAASTYLSIVDAASAYLTIVDAASAYQPISGMSSYLTTSAAAANYYPLSSNPAGYLTSASLSGYALLSGATFTGKINTPAVTTASAFLNLPHGTAPTTPVNGDVWSTTGGIFWRQNGATQQACDLGGTQTIGGSKTFSNASLTLGNSTAAGTINVGTGATVSGSTRTINIGTASAAGSTNAINIGGGSGTSTTTLQGNLLTNGTSNTIGNSTATQQVNIGTGATISGSIKTISIGDGGQSGSTTNISIGQNVGVPSGIGNITIGSTTNSTTTLNGTVNATTATAGTSTTQIATTAFVTTADNLKANIASPSLTGTPLSTTAAADTNTTQIATTAYVVGQAGSATPLVNGTAAVGTSLRFARADHVHPTDTTRAAVNSPAFTGTPSLPTGTTAVTQTAGNNTTALATTAFVQAALPVVATTAQINSPLNNTALMTPSAARQMMMFPGFQQFLGGGSTGTSGTGAVAPSTANRWRQLQGPNVSVAGYSAFVFDIQNSAIGFVGSKRGSNEYGKNYARALWMSGRTLLGTDDGGFGGDVNNLYRCELGGRNNIATSGDPDRASLGWRVAGGGSSAIVFYMRSRSAGNGGTYSETTTSFSPVYNQWFDWQVTYNGTDTCQMFVNDTLVGTISANFTGFQGESFNYYSERIEQTASAATRLEVNTLPPRIYFSE